ncbi:hypothetical protein YC2023_016032 [Brassica napus]
MLELSSLSDAGTPCYHPTISTWLLNKLKAYDSKKRCWKAVEGWKNCWLRQEVSMERRQGGQIFGKAEWFDRDLIAGNFEII